MKRRGLFLQLAAAGLKRAPIQSGGIGPSAWPARAGRSRARTTQTGATGARSRTPAGKIEVIEFFSYGCPHCFALGTDAGALANRLPADVVFKRVPVGFNAPPGEPQKIFYALEAMGQVEQHAPQGVQRHPPGQRLRMTKEADMPPS